MCGYQRGTVECADNGFLWDADGDGFSEGDNKGPCPGCNTKAYLDAARETAEASSFISFPGGSGTGQDVWHSAVGIAIRANRRAAEAALAEIGTVSALVHEPGAPGGYREVPMSYPASFPDLIAA